jgi:hypothetical protein
MLGFVDVPSNNKAAMLQAIQIETRSEQRGLNHHQEEVIKLIIPDSIFDRDTKIHNTSAIVTEPMGQPARILGPQRLRQQEQR